jgi:hypothetical protein
MQAPVKMTGACFCAKDGKIEVQCRSDIAEQNKKRQRIAAVLRVVWY